MAIWALVLGWIPCLIGFVVSVVFAILVLNRSRRGPDHGRKLAIGGLVGVAYCGAKALSGIARLVHLVPCGGGASNGWAGCRP